MKTRNGFVSNSSSSSFTCDVCGDTQSGMDMGLSECGMFECEFGHTVCDSHQKAAEMSAVEKREFLVSQIKRRTWAKPEEIELDVEEVNNMTSDVIDIRYHDYANDGVPAKFCPICMFDKLTDKDALHYLMWKTVGMSKSTIAEQIRKEFQTYDTFKKSVYQKQS